MCDLALVGAGAILAACTLSKPTAAPTAAQAATSAPTSAPEPTAVPPTVAPTAVPPTAAPAPVTLSVLMAPEEGFGDITPDKAFWKYLTEATGAHFEILRVPYGTLGQQVSLKIAAGNIPTIMIIESPADSGLTAWAFTNKYGMEGLFVKLDEYFDKLPSLNETADAYKDMKAWMKAGDGHSYGFPSAEYGDWASGLGLRADFLKDCGYIQDPWNPPPSRDFIKTLDDLYKILLCFKDKLGGKPVVGSRNGPAYTYRRWTDFFATKTGSYYNPKTNKYEYGPLMKRYRIFVDYLNKMFNDGILHPEYATMSDPDWQSKMDNHEWGASMDHRGQHPGWNLGRPFFVQSLDIDGERVIWPHKSIFNTSNMAVISAKAPQEQIDAAIKVFDYLYSKPGQVMGEFGKEGVEYKVGADGKFCLSETMRCDGYDPTAWCGGKAPSSDVPDYHASDLKDAGGLQRMNYIEYRWDEWMFIYGKQGDDIKYVFKAFDTEGSSCDPIVPLTYTAEEQDTLAKLLAPLDTYILEETQKFVEGGRALNDDEWAKFTAKAEEMGGKQVADIDNAALARV